MKHLLLILLLLGFSPLSAQVEEEKAIVTELPFNSPYALNVPGAQITHSDQGTPLWTFSRTVDVESDQALNLFRIQNLKITQTRCAVLGEVAYQNLPSGSRLVLVSSDPEAISFTSPTETEIDDDQSLITGTSHFRRFWLPFYVSSQNTGGDHPLQLEVRIRIAGSSVTGSTKSHLESISLCNLKLIQYPPIPAPPKSPTMPHFPPVMAPQTSTTPSFSRNWPSFWVGTTVSTAMLLALAQLLIQVRRWKHARNDREMRRIASLDS